MALVALAAAPAGAATPGRGEYDARPLGSAKAGGATLRERLGRFGLVTAEPRTGTPRAVARLDGFLTGRSARPAAAIALGYVREHPGVFRLDGDDVDGLRLVRRTRAGGLEHLTWEQRHRGIPSADTKLQAAVTASGRLLSITGPPAPDLAVPSIVPAVAVERAYAAVRGAGVAVRRRAGGPERATTFADGGRASLVLYQDGDGARLGWRVLAPVSSSAVYDALVDAASGAVVRRSNRVDFVSGMVFRSNPRDTPTQESVSFDAWLTGTNLSGRFAHAFVDALDEVGPFELDVPAGNEVSDFNDPLKPIASPPGTGCTDAAPCTWSAGVANSWLTNRNQSATQLFYLVNTFHDHLAAAPIGFTGFEDDDPVLAQSLDGAGIAGGLPDGDHVNNASFLTLPDGEPGLMQTHLFSHLDSPFGDYDSANDASVIFHEYTHGLSNRLVTDAAGFGALNTAQAGAIGEATSDFYALDFLVEQGLMADGPGADVLLGSYLDGGAGALRFQAIDTPVPAGFTYADFGAIAGEPEVHSDGEIWAQTLWDLRGIPGARAAITQAMRLAPPEPSFLDMRNAILAAHLGDDTALWDVFAARGMGYFASTDGSADVAPIADDSPPPPPASGVTLSGVVRNDDGQPLAGARVGIAGHDTQGRGGLGPELADDTDAAGAYGIAAPLGADPYPLVTARRTGLRTDREVNVSVPRTGLDFVLERDWSSSLNGASVERFSGPDNSLFGCGPRELIDDRADTAWGSDRSSVGQTIVVDLGVPIDVAKVALDPGAGCGDDPSAGLGAYELTGSTGPAGEFRPLGLPGAFPAGQGGFLQDIAGSSADQVRYVRLHAKTPQDTSPDGSGALFLDVTELHVARKPGSPLGPSVETGAAQAVGANSARLTGSVTPRGGSAQVVFEYGPTTAYGSTVAATTVAAGNTPVAVAAVAGGLAPLRLYHFRAVAVRNGVRYPGSDATFLTGSPPVVTPPPPGGGGGGSAATHATVVSSRLVANRRGRFKVRIAFAADAPAGRARLAVKLRGRNIAARGVDVSFGETVTARLRLSKRGRRAIRPGRSKRVQVQLTLPGGELIAKSMRLVRRRR